MGMSLLMGGTDSLHEYTTPLKEPTSSVLIICLPHKSARIYEHSEGKTLPPPTKCQPPISSMREEILNTNALKGLEGVNQRTGPLLPLHHRVRKRSGANHKIDSEGRPLKVTKIKKRKKLQNRMCLLASCGVTPLTRSGTSHATNWTGRLSAIPSC